MKLVSCDGGFMNFILFCFSVLHLKKKCGIEDVRT